MINLLRQYRKSGLYLAAILFVPGALIAVPILWWLDRRHAIRDRASAELAAAAKEQWLRHRPVNSMPSFLRSVVTWLALPALALVATAALAQEYGPDALVRALSHDVIAAIKQNRDIRAGNRHQLFELVEKMILPHVDTARMTRLAMGLSWRKATPEQQQRLTREFTTLLVHTYSGALASYSDRVMNIKPLRAQAGDSEVAVRSEVRQPGGQAIAVDYAMGKTPSGWKIYDIKIDGVSLVSTYRVTFSEEVRNHGIDGLIGLLSNKNRQNGKRIAPVQS